MFPLAGNAAFTWTDAGAERVHLLALPLQGQKLGTRQRVFPQDSADFTAREVVTVGVGVYELAATIAYDPSPQSLVELLRAGIRGLVLTYWPDLTANGPGYDCYLIEPSAVPADLDQAKDYPVFLEAAVNIRLRRTDGSAFS